MSEYWRFFRGESSLLTYGVSLTFFSSFGQTFLISLFVPYFLVDFSLTAGEFGTYYAVATLGSAFLLIWTGRWLDRTKLTRFSVAVVVLMALSAFLLAGSEHLWVFCLALLGLRLAGQGLSSHTAVTSMARYFGPRRGKALSISSLGYPLGEAFLPLAVAGSIALIGWRQSWALMGFLALAIVAPLLVSLLLRSGVELNPRNLGLGLGNPVSSEASPIPDTESASWGRGRVLRDPRFWFVLPAALLPPFWATGLILYQTSIAELKGWSLTLMASAFAIFALFRVVSALAVGDTIDRLSARHLFPFCVLPLGIAMAFLWLFGGAWAAYVFMAFLGMSMGMSGTALSALWAELYGVKELGAIKAMATAFMVVSTAASPLLVGVVLDGGGGLEPVLIGGLASVLVGALLALRVFPRADPVSAGG